jgi:hypothetical protein
MAAALCSFTARAGCCSSLRARTVPAPCDSALHAELPGRAAANARRAGGAGAACGQGTLQRGPAAALPGHDGRGVRREAARAELSHPGACSGVGLAMRCAGAGGQGGTAGSTTRRGSLRWPAVCRGAWLRHPVFAGASLCATLRCARHAWRRPGATPRGLMHPIPRDAACMAERRPGLWRRAWTAWWPPRAGCWRTSSGAR